MVSPPAWPAVTWEERAWKSRVPPDMLSRAMRERSTGPYRACLPPPIADLSPRLPVDTHVLIDEATAEIARFDAEMGGEIAPFAAVLLRSESASSSMIENLTAGARAIALAELGSAERRNAIEIVGNVDAMRAAIALADRIDPPAILDMHRALLVRVEPGMAGSWRSEQVWIGGTALSPHSATFVPPHHERVPALIDDLITFVERADLPVLVQAAVAHAQFETIHPFVDGNGRTGRALIHALLRGRGLTRTVTLPVSAGLLTDTAGYFASLTAYRDGDPTPIVTRLASAAFLATANGRELIQDLRALRSGWQELIRARSDSAVWRLADLVLRQPVVDAATVAAGLGTAPQNAHRLIAPLVEAGILTEFTGQRRNRLWQAGDVLAALDAFAARAGRRTPSQ